MRIVEAGSNKKTHTVNRVRFITCNCGTKIEYTKDDAFTRKRASTLGTTLRYSLMCPKCEKKLRVRLPIDDTIIIGSGEYLTFETCSDSEKIMSIATFVSLCKMGCFEGVPGVAMYLDDSKVTDLVCHIEHAKKDFIDERFTNIFWNGEMTPQIKQVLGF